MSPRVRRWIGLFRFARLGPGAGGARALKSAAGFAPQEDAMAKGADKPNTNKSNKPKLSTKEKQEKKKAKKEAKGS